MKKDNLVGNTYGRLRVMSLSHIDDKHNTVWNCVCECGTCIKVLGYHLKSGHTLSCGCLRKDKITKHGLCRTKLHNVWNSMLDRTTNKNSKYYYLYGGRGIGVCDEWKDFTSFSRWAYSNGYKQGLSIERINNDVGYCPENCRWATMKEQSRNRRTNRFITINGTTLTVTEWIKAAGTHAGTFYARLRKGLGVEEALFTGAKR